MIVTNEEKIYEFLKKARNHGSSKRYFHEFLGYNFRMTEMQAALGRMQLKKLGALNKRRIKNALYLNLALKNIKGLILPKVSSYKKHVFHQYTIIVDEDFSISRQELLTVFDKKGIEYRIFYPLPIHKQPALKKLVKPIRLPVSEELSKKVISLPNHPYLKKEELKYIAQTIKDIVKSTI